MGVSFAFFLLLVLSFQESLMPQRVMVLSLSFLFLGFWFFCSAQKPHSFLFRSQLWLLGILYCGGLTAVVGAWNVKHMVKTS